MNLNRMKENKERITRKICSGLLAKFIYLARTAFNQWKRQINMESNEELKSEIIRMILN